MVQNLYSNYISNPPPNDQLLKNHIKRDQSFQLIQIKFSISINQPTNKNNQSI